MMLDIPAHRIVSVIIRGAIMEEHNERITARTTQHWLASRFRQRYEACQMALAGQSTADQQSRITTARAAAPAVSRQDTAGMDRLNHADAAQYVAPPRMTAGERYVTLFSKAYAAARHFPARDRRPQTVPRVRWEALSSVTALRLAGRTPQFRSL